jgi:alpha-tubulin suppressor-like RCC1 family protein
VRSDGTVVAWGNIAWGQTSVPAGLSNVVAVAAGTYIDMALKSDGNVVTWSSWSSTNIPANLHNVSAIANGDMALIGSGSPFVLQPDIISKIAPESGTTRLQVSAFGAGTLTYQWLFNGSSVVGATNSVLILTNVQTNQAGVYSVVVANSLGAATNSTTLSVAPLLMTQKPESLLALVGTTVTLSGEASGVGSIRYQWKFNGVDIPGATNSVFAITNVQLNQGGAYALIASNTAAVVQSDQAVLSLSQVIGWGFNHAGLAALPFPLTNIIAIASGYQHDLALRADGKVIAWGANGDGQTNVPVALTNVVSISAGWAFSAALQANSRIVAWGHNFYSETNVPSNLTNAVALSCGDQHALALRDNGTVIVWGQNLYGQTNVPAGLTNVVAIAAGNSHSVALKSNGRVIAWGGNTKGQTNIPVNLTNVIAIAAGGDHNLALMANGSVFAWGDNFYGQTNVPPSATNIVAIEAGLYHSLALRADGSVIAWGYNFYAQSSIPPGVGYLSAIAGGGYHSLAIADNLPPITEAKLLNPFKDSNGFHVSVPTQSGRVYALEYKDFLPNGQWFELPLVAGSGQTVILTDPSGSTNQRYYRVRRW